ncbi:transposase [Actinoplanes sp. HUAS TT8]|uniref:transposase n=1 Tax=Actinoplanes sp. HUAS TT8 TaxID=3447453 RepID=UPI003F524D87
MALVRVYCGLASADDSVRSASAAPLNIAVVDDAGRLLGVHEISDDPAGYALLGTLLVERTTGFSDAAVAADSDDHVVTSLLTAAGRPLVVVDDDDADDFAERFSDDDSPEEISAPAAARRAIGLARALQAGAIAAVNLPAPRELVSYKPVLAAHVAMLAGRNSSAVALREVLRELYPAALRAYPDPAHPLAMAVLDAIPEPGRLTGRGDEPAHHAQDVAIELTRAGAGTEDQVIAAVTALQVAISESPRRGGVNKSLAPAAAEAVRHAIAAVRTCDAACAALVGTLTARATSQATEPNVGRRASRRSAEPPAPAAAPPVSSDLGSRFSRRSRPEPAVAGLGGPAVPQPMNAPPVAPDPIGPPPVAPAAANGLPGRISTPGNRPVSVPPPPPGMTPITPGTRPVPGSRNPVAPASPAARSPISPAARNPISPAARNPISAGGLPSSPADAGEPFRPTLTNAELNRARAERQRTVIPTRPPTRPSSPAPATNGSATDFSLPMPTQRPAEETPEPGSRANWPLLNTGDDTALPQRTAAASVSGPGASSGAEGRIRPPWQDMPKEPPALHLVDTQLNGSRGKAPGIDQIGDPPSLRLIDGGARTMPVEDLPPRITALDRSTAPPVPADGSDGDLLIFAAARSAWFTGGTSDPGANVEWANPNDSGWRAAQKAATPAVAAETSAGLPKRVPQANLVPGTTVREERPLRIVRDAASIAAHTTGYFRGWRRGQEIGGFAMGGRPGREAAGGWDFTRDGQPADEYRNNGAGYGGNR